MTTALNRAAFHSDGLTLDASIYLPDDGGAADRPVVLSCSGFTGLKNIHPARFARGLTARGYACVGFDYRGFGDSEGPRDVVFCEEQVRDIANAVAWVASRDELAGRPLYLLGWGMGGGLVLESAVLVREQLSGVLAINGFFDAIGSSARCAATTATPPSAPGCAISAAPRSARPRP